jgi:CBS domain-containing protein
MQVSELMTTDPVTVAPDDSVATVVELMQDQAIRHLPVVDEQGDLVGMISDRDIRGLLLPVLPNSLPEKATQMSSQAAISSIMTSAPLSVDMESESAVAAELMIEHRVGAIPVVDADGSLVGIVSYVDLLRHYVEIKA